jgi:hypothetical protein
MATCEHCGFHHPSQAVVERHKVVRHSMSIVPYRAPPPKKKAPFAQRLQSGFSRVRGGIEQAQGVADVIAANVNFDMMGEGFAGLGGTTFNEGAIIQQGFAGIGGNQAQKRQAHHRKKRSGRGRRITISF